MQTDSKPQIGEYFISKSNTFCQMINDTSYIDFTLKSGKPLYYVEGSHQFSKLRNPSNQEIDMKQTIETINILSKNINPSKLFNTINAFAPAKNEFSIDFPVGHDTAKGLEQLEAAYIEFAYREAKYNQVKAARNLGISRGNLRTKLKIYFGDTYL